MNASHFIGRLNRLTRATKPNPIARLHRLLPPNTVSPLSHIQTLTQTTPDPYPDLNSMTKLKLPRKFKKFNSNTLVYSRI